MYPRFQRFQRVAWINGHHFLGQHRSGVHTFIRHQVHHYAGVLDLPALVCFEGTLDGIDAREGPGQRRVQVDDAIGKVVKECR